MQLKVIIFASLLFGIQGQLSAGLFGPSDGPECAQKYAPQSRYQPARSLILVACTFGYENNLIDDGAWKKPGRCISSKSNQMYSYESTLKVIHECTKGDQSAFNVFKNRFEYSVQLENEPSRPTSRNPNPVDLTNNGDESYTVFDLGSGQIKNCRRIGTTVACF